MSTAEYQRRWRASKGARTGAPRTRRRGASLGFYGLGVDTCRGMWLDSPMSNTDRIPNNTEVIVRHEMGSEVGTVLSSTRGDLRRYTVRFADGTISSWGAQSVEVAR